MTHFSSLTRPVRGATHALARPLAALGLLLATASAAQAQALPPAPASARAAVPEASGYSILYQLDLPNAAAFNAGGVPYSINNSGAVLTNPARVAYYIELTNGTTTTYVWASMANFATTLTQLGIPNPTSNNVSLHQNVSGLNVFSNVAGVTTGSNLGTGRVEMWPTDYGTANSDAVPGASGSTFDFGDQPVAGGYGSFQVHNVTAGQTVFAYNNWGGNGGNSDLGIGNQVGGSGHPDWTFQNNANQYSVKRITILVNTPANNALAFDGADDYVALPSSTPVPVGSSAYTIEAWIKPNAMGVYGIIGWGNYGTSNQVNALRLDANGVYNYWWANDIYAPTGSLAGAWHHVAATFDGTTRRIYIDGVIKAQDTPTTLLNVPNASNLRIGSTCPGPCGGEYFPGSIDEVRVYSVGLTAAQVQADMYSTSAAVPGSLVAYFNMDQGAAGGSNPGITSLTNRANANPGTLTNFGLSGTTSNWVRSFPTITGISPSSGPVGTSVSFLGTNLNDATSFAFNGTTATGVAVANDFSATAPVPSGATTGLVSLASATLAKYNGPAFTLAYPDLVISTAGFTIPNGIYNNITVASGGSGTPNGDVTVNTALVVQSGGTLADGCSLFMGGGTFTLQSGGTLNICRPRGILSSQNTALGNLGAVRVLGARSYSPDASYVYSGGQSQDTGDGLPALVRNLTVGTSTNISLTNPLAVAQVLTLSGTGNLATAGNALTLLSTAAGTALVVNSGTGTVVGAATVQRYLDASGNTGTSGYRHYAAPVSGATVASLSTSAYGGGFTAQTNTAYNTADPNLLTLATYPNVFGYDESKIAASPAVSFSDFDKGYQSPASTGTALTVGRGYAVQIGNAEKVQFTGTLNTGNGTIGGLTRAAAGSAGAASAGWALVGNPYPAPLDWGTVAGSQLSGVDAAAYVFQSTSAYTGRYTSFINGIGANSGLLAAGQGFFVRTSAAGTTGSIALTNANRATTYGATPKFQRTTADVRPQLRLSLALGSAPATIATAQDETFVYFEQGATSGFDGQYDAYKLPNPSGYYLGTAAVVPAGTPDTGLSIDGRAPLTTASTTIPVWLSVPAGTYTLTATALLNFAPTGTQVYLRDAFTGTLTDLATAPSYSFGVAANAPSTGRFTLIFGSATPLATTSAALGQVVASLYPNPTDARDVTLAVTGLPTDVRTLDATLTDALGRPVGRYTLPASQGAARASLPTQGLASGLYLLRLAPLSAQGAALGTLPAQRLNVR